MQELKMNDEKTKDFFIHAFSEKSMVPILGSGFSTGFKTAKGGCVPSGTDLKNYMIDMIVAKKKFDREEMCKENFSSIAQSFQKNFPEPDTNNIIDYFVKNYIGVIIDKTHQLRFLNEIEWDYIYTLNVDTAIEDSKDSKWEVFYPNRKFDERIRKEGYRKLYKIHGDVCSFCKNLSYDEMILTENQYIKSLEHNKQFHDLLAADCGDKNLIYIGCSLDDEIDIKYSVISDENRNYKGRETRGIYVTAEKLSERKKEKLEEFNISHVIQLANTNEFEMFYEFIVECYLESCKNRVSNIDQYKFVLSEKLDNNREKNIEYLADITDKRGIIPFYYVPSSLVNIIHMVSNKVNVIIGRRFVGKSMLAYSILENYPNYRRYFVSGQESLSYDDIKALLTIENSIIIFDSDSLDDREFINIIETFAEDNNNIVCVFINSYSDVINVLSSYPHIINFALKDKLNGKFQQKDLDAINSKLDDLGIVALDEKQNLLNNTLRIANVYEKKILSQYVISNVEELEFIIWILVKNKLYYEDAVTLGLARSFNTIVRKYSPLIQQEFCKKGEMKRHSHTKAICNGKLGLLQILSTYIYVPKTDLEIALYQTRQKNICEAIYRILSCFDKFDQNAVKSFLMFDTLNEIFSRIYSKQSIDFLTSDGKEGRRLYGASAMIHEIYNEEKIKQLKSGDPNYWLQRAKSVYITNYRREGASKELLEAVDWAKKAEHDSRLKIERGEKKFLRTESNAIMQLAMLYGKLAKLENYADVSINDSALIYYYASFSDLNNINAAKTLMYNSKGTDDFEKFVKHLLIRPNCVTLERERNYLVSIHARGEVLYTI